MFLLRFFKLIDQQKSHCQLRSIEFVNPLRVCRPPLLQFGCFWDTLESRRSDSGVVSGVAVFLMSSAKSVKRSINRKRHSISEFFQCLSIILSSNSQLVNSSHRSLFLFQIQIPNYRVNSFIITSSISISTHNILCLYNIFY